MKYKSYKIRLELNNKQITMCKGHTGVARHAYNYFVNYCREEYEKGNKLPTAIDMHKLLVANVKSSNSWYYEYSKFTPQKSLMDLETAYKNFHRKQKKSGYKLLKYKTINGIKTSIGLEGLPQFKKKGIKDSFYLEGKIVTKDNKIKIPKFGWVKCSEILPHNQEIKNVTISRQADSWFISFKILNDIKKTIKSQQIVGVDLGIKTLATLSNGESFENPKPYKFYKKKLRKLQKELSRRYNKNAKSQSKNYIKTKNKLSKIHKKISDIRKDSLHKLTTYLSKNFETVVIEDLKVKNMVKNHNLASAILDGGMFEFKRQLLYKKEWYGGNVLLVNTFYPSSKLCSNCGDKNNSLKLSERKWTCSSCNTVHDRDNNASINLEKLAVSSTVLAFGDESSVGTKNPTQLVDELGIKHQMFTFV